MVMTRMPSKFQIKERTGKVDVEDPSTAAKAKCSTPCHCCNETSVLVASGKRQAIIHRKVRHHVEVIPNLVERKRRSAARQVLSNQQMI